MKTHHTVWPLALALSAAACSTTADAPVEPVELIDPLHPPSPFEDGVRIEADGQPINVSVGHLVPCAVDWNADGKKDLLIGQFSGGSVRLYLNHGTDVSPEFGDFSYLDAGGQEIHLPAG